jgi:hypothetical protein
MRKKYSKRAELRQWWKLFKSRVEVYGIRYTIWNEIKIFYPFRKMDNLYWYIHYIFNPFNVVKIKSLPRSYTDKDEVMLHANFQLLVNYIEEEKPFQYGPWEDEHKPEYAVAGKDLQELYAWWKAREKRIDPFDKMTVHRDFDDMFEDEPAAVDEDGDPTLFTMKPAEGEYLEQLTKAGAERDAFEKEDQDNLERLIKLRDYLWT